MNVAVRSEVCQKETYCGIERCINQCKLILVIYVDFRKTTDKILTLIYPKMELKDRKSTYVLLV